MENKTVTLSRHLAMVTLVDRNPGITLEELGRVFGFTADRMRREILLLDHAGIGELLPDETFFFDMDLLERTGQVRLQYDLGASDAQPLTDAEVTRLIMGLAAIAGSLAPDEVRTVPHLLSLILAFRGSDDRPELPDISQLLAVVDGQESPWEETINSAFSNHRQLNLTYLDANSQLTRRTVDPIAKVQMPGGWVLRAWCYRARAERNFRTDRIVDASLGDKSEPNQKRRSPRVGGEICKVTLEHAARWLLGEIPIESARSVHAGHLVTFRVWDARWMAEQLILLAPYVVHVEPGHYQDLAREIARQSITIWEDLPAADNDVGNGEGE